jgi:hypothetical protein
MLSKRRSERGEPALPRGGGTLSHVALLQVSRRKRGCGSALAVHCDGERAADLLHAIVSEAAEALYEDTGRNALDGVEVHRARARDRVGARFQQDLGGELADRRRARSDQRTSKPRDRGVTREHDYGPPANVGQLAPPHLAPRWEVGHEAPAASRNAARSPHSSG